MTNHEKPHPCARCGLMKRGRKATLCGDCRFSLSREENAIWKAQMLIELAHERKAA